MTAADQLSGLTSHDFALTCVIDGVPIMFGTEAGIVHPLDTFYGVAGTNFPSSLTSVNAIHADSVKFGKQELNMEARMVRPSSMSFNLRLADITDTDWDDYFNMRKAPVTTLVSDVTESGTSFSVAASTSFTSGTQVYLHSESAKITSLGAGTLNVTRNYMRINAPFRPQAHTVGTEIRTTPRMWFGRWCEVRTWVGGETQQIWYMQLSAPPTRDKSTGEWRLTFDDIMRVFDRDVAVGFEGAAVVGIQDASTGGEPFIQLTPEAGNTREFQDHATRLGSLLISNDEGDWAAERITDFTGTSPVISGNNWYSRFGDWNTISNMKRCNIFTGPPMLAALQIMLSNRGLGENHATYDTLFGITAYGNGATGRIGQGEKEIRMGANIPAGLLDMTTLTGDILNETCAGFHLVLGASGQQKLLTILEGIAYALNGDWFINSAGLISFRRDEGYLSTTSADYTISDDDIERDETPLVSLLDETSIAPLISIACNHDPMKNKFMGELISIFEQEAQTYEGTPLAAKTLRTQRLDLLVNLRGANLADLTGGFGHAPASENTVRVGLERTQTMLMSGLLKFTVVLPWRFSNIRPGMRVNITCVDFIDFAGNTLSNKDFKVLTSQPTEDGKIAITVQEHWSGKIIAPTFQVLSYAAGVITLKSSAKWTPVALAATPTVFLATGWGVKVLRRAAATRYAQYESFTVATIPSATTLTLSGVPSWGSPAVNDLLVFDDYDTATGTNTNAQQSLAQHGHAFMSDVFTLLGSGPAEPDKWG